MRSTDPMDASRHEFVRMALATLIFIGLALLF